MAFWNYCAICGKGIEVGEPCLGIERKNTKLFGDSICFDCVNVENMNGFEKTLSITDILSRAEAAESRANDAELALCGVVANYFRVNEVAKKILNYARDDGTPEYMKDDLYEAAIMLFGVDEAQIRAENATERAKEAEKDRDVAISDFEEYVRGGEEVCKYCEHDEDCEPGETKCGALRRNGFKYRGAKKS